jgi:superfamily I DNA/RNA helicase
VVHVLQACITQDTQGNNSHRRGKKNPITNRGGQERIKLRQGNDEPITARKVASLINSIKQQNLKNEQY